MLPKCLKGPADGESYSYSDSCDTYFLTFMYRVDNFVLNIFVINPSNPFNKRNSDMVITA